VPMPFRPKRVKRPIDLWFKPAKKHHRRK
jgi:hypothetical protein